MSAHERRIRTYASVSTSALSFLVVLTVGILMLVRPPILRVIIPYTLSGLFALLFLAEIVRLILSHEPLKAEQGIRLTVYAAATAAFFGFTDIVWFIMNLLLSLYALVLALASFISLWQYRHEHRVHLIWNIVSGCFHLIFSLTFLLVPARFGNYVLILGGCYLICYAFTFWFEMIFLLTPEKNRRHMMNVPLPLFWSTFIPMRALRAYNKKYDDDPGCVQELGENYASNPVEILFHITRYGANAFGHVDMVVDGRIYSYGCYDNEQSSLFGGAGPGVLFTLENIPAYIRLTYATSGSMVFAYGLNLTDEQLEKLRGRLNEILSNSVPYLSKAELAEQGRLPQKRYRDYPSRLHTTCGATLMKFSAGLYRHFFVLGTNCVAFVDDLLGAAGLGRIAAGIISPGTYYARLERELTLPGGFVAYRRVYRRKKRGRKADRTETEAETNSRQEKKDGDPQN